MKSLALYDIALTAYITIAKTHAVYRASSQKRVKKDKGQFFTPPSIAQFMARQITIKNSYVLLLDPGAGAGILTGAVCEQLISSEQPLQIEAHLFENDPDMLSVLGANLTYIQQAFHQTEHTFQFVIFSEDFIERNACVFDEQHLFCQVSNTPKYDIIILNPPYFKLSKTHHHSCLMRQIVHGQPNVYMFFLAICAALLQEHGQMVCITPRSYCSGLYFKKFRHWFLHQVTPVSFHLFASRKNTFKQDVLQEAVILKAIKQDSHPSHIKITTSGDADLDDIQSLSVPYETVVPSTNPDFMIHLPSNEIDLEITDILRSWQTTFFNSGFRISTGPVVSFRAAQYLSENVAYDGIYNAPLLWMNHLKNFSIQFPLKGIKKPQTIQITEESSKLLIKNQHYVFLKRFSAKEQKKRLYASYYSPTLLPHTKYLGLENHVNYIWKPVEGLSQQESLGIMAILNSSLFDSYFRVMNGNTQVNATEIHHLPFPPYDAILAIGKEMEKITKLLGPLIDTIVMNILHIPQRIHKNPMKGNIA